MHELRKDPLFSRWVAVLEQSQGPEAYGLPPESRDSECVLCSGREHETLPELASIREPGTEPNKPGWWTRAIPSYNPFLASAGELGRRGVGMYDRMNSIGVNEIIVESPAHEQRPEDMGPEQFRRVLELYRMRIVDIEKDARVRYVLISKNSGRWAGSQYSHPHSIVIATPVIPYYIKTELDGAKQYFAYKERCIFCDMIGEEQRAGQRVIAETGHFIAYCPFAPKFPFEFWVLPKMHRCAFDEISPEEMNDLGVLLSSLIKKMRRVLREPAYSYVLHTAPNRIPRRDHWHTLGDDFHWHLEIAPRLMRVSGLEWSSEFYVLTTSPEDAAKYMREA